MILSTFICFWKQSGKSSKLKGRYYLLMQGTWIGEECQGVGAGLSSRQTNRLFPPPSTSHTSQLHLFVHTSCTPLCTPLCTRHHVHSFQLHLNIYPLPAAALSCTCNLFEACWAFFVTSIFFATINFSQALPAGCLRMKSSSQMTDRQAMN